MVYHTLKKSRAVFNRRNVYVCALEFLLNQGIVDWILHFTKPLTNPEVAASKLFITELSSETDIRS